MDGDTLHLKPLLVGEHRRLTGAAVLLAGGLFSVAGMVRYVALSRIVAGSGTNVFFDVQQTFMLAPIWEHRALVPTTWVYGYLLAIGLAGSHAYFNRGYLPSVLLAVAPQVGVAQWSIHGMDAYIALTPALVFDRVFPEGVLVPTFGFVLGLALREGIRGKLSSQPPASDPPDL